MQTLVHPSVVISSEAFRQGFDSGMNGTNRFCLTCYPKEDDLVAIITNIVEISQEGWLTEELVRRDVGMIAGWLTRCVADIRPAQ